MSADLFLLGFVAAVMVQILAAVVRVEVRLRRRIIELELAASRRPGGSR